MTIALIHSATTHSNTITSQFLTYQSTQHQPPWAYCEISREIEVRVMRYGGRDDCPMCQLRITEGRPGLTVWFGEGVNPVPPIQPNTKNCPIIPTKNYALLLLSDGDLNTLRRASTEFCCTSSSNPTTVLTTDGYIKVVHNRAVTITQKGDSRYFSVSQFRLKQS